MNQNYFLLQLLVQHFHILNKKEIIPNTTNFYKIH